MIISLHTPKAGGSSFSALLKDYFKSKFKADYKDLPLNKPFDERTEDAKKQRKNIRRFKKYLFKILDVQCIHGHFLPYKYIDLKSSPDTKFVTWLRDPIERLGSHYHYWQRSATSHIGPPLKRKVIEEQWTIQEFCFSEELRNFYSKFLWNFPVENFDFIGISEYFEDDLNYFAQNFLNLNSYPPPNLNVNPDKKSNYFQDEGLIKALKKFHQEDYKIYEKALKKREERIKPQGTQPFPET